MAAEADAKGLSGTGLRRSAARLDDHPAAEASQKPAYMVAGSASRARHASEKILDPGPDVVGANPSTPEARPVSFFDRAWLQGRCLRQAPEQAQRDFINATLTARVSCKSFAQLAD